MYAEYSRSSSSADGWRAEEADDVWVQSYWAGYLGDGVRIRATVLAAVSKAFNDCEEETTVAVV